MFEGNDKKSIIQSMKKIINYVSDKPQNQTETFRSLQQEDLINIIDNLNDDNQYLRRTSLLFICELLYNNSVNKIKFAQMLNIQPKYGRISITFIPIKVMQYPQSIKKSLQLLKDPIKSVQQSKFCWSINFDKKNLQMDFHDYKKFSSFTFLDPKTCLVGFTTKSYIQSFKFKSIRIKTGIQDNRQNKIIDYTRQNSQKRQQSLERQIQNMKSKGKKYPNKTINIADNHKEHNYITTRNKIHQISQYARNSYGGQQKQKISYSFKRPSIDADYVQRRRSISKNSQYYKDSSRSKQKKINSRSKQKRQQRLRSSQKFFDRIKKLLKE